MESIKQFVESLKGKIDDALKNGNIFVINEITANLMMGSIVLMMILLTILCEILNELGIFTADKLIMRWTVALSLIIEIPILMINKKTKGEPQWLKDVMIWGILAISCLLSSSLGHNVTLIMAVPILVSIRYCDVKVTRRTIIASLLMFTLALFGNGYFGIINLNILKLPIGTSLEVESTLREAILQLDIDRTAYIKSLILNDYLPKLVIFSLLGCAAIEIAKRCRQMSELQDNISKKTSRLETELNLATEIQASMLPCIFPAFPEHGELDLFAINYPAKEVGGDFYDYFVIDDDHIAVVMADVSGKGVGAALFMTIAKIVLKNQLMLCPSPAEAMMNTNKQLCENNDAELFVTVWCGIYEISTMTMTYANAGHNPPVIYRKGQKCEFLPSKKGFVLAGLETSKYVDNKIQLNNGDELFLYTDGVTEANDKDKNLFGDDRLLKNLDLEINKPVMDQVNSLMSTLNKYMEGTEQFDDITMMGIKIKEK